MDISKLTRLRAGTTGRLVASPSVVVSWDDGRARIASSNSNEAISTADARLLQVLHAFASPRTPQEVSDKLRQLGAGFLFAAVSALWEIDALVVADDATVESDDGATAATDEGAVSENAESNTDGAASPSVEKNAARSVEGRAERGHAALAEGSNREAQERAARLAQLVYSIACDLAGFGADAHRAPEDVSGEPSLSARLGGVERVLSGVAEELRDRRAAYLASQLARLGLAPGAKGLRLHLGSGEARLEGWVNVDLPPAELSLHLGWGLPFADESAEYVYLSHVLEHLYRDEALELLRETRRVLAPAGVLRLVVPDVEKCLRAYASGDEGFFETRKTYWPRTSRDFVTPLEHLLKNAGAGVRPGRFFGHKYGYDFRTLAHVLRLAGFARVERSEYMSSAHAPLLLDSRGRTTGFQYRGAYYSMFVEATR